MKRDKKLLLTILEGIEGIEPHGRLEIKLDDWTEDQVVYHLNLLGEEGLVKLRNVVPAYHVYDNVFRIIIPGMTMAGHDYLDELRST